MQLEESKKEWTRLLNEEEYNSKQLMILEGTKAKLTEDCNVLLKEIGSLRDEIFELKKDPYHKRSLYLLKWLLSKNNEEEIKLSVKELKNTDDCKNTLIILVKMVNLNNMKDLFS